MQVKEKLLYGQLSLLLGLGKCFCIKWCIFCWFFTIFGIIEYKNVFKPKCLLLFSLLDIIMKTLVLQLDYLILDKSLLKYIPIIIFICKTIILGFGKMGMNTIILKLFSTWNVIYLHRCITDFMFITDRPHLDLFKLSIRSLIWGRLSWNGDDKLGHMLSYIELYETDSDPYFWVKFIVTITYISFIIYKYSVYFT